MYVQLREDAVEGRAGAAGDGEEEPDWLAAEEGAHARGVILSWLGGGRIGGCEGGSWFITVELMLLPTLHAAWFSSGSGFDDDCLSRGRLGGSFRVRRSKSL